MRLIHRQIARAACIALSLLSFLGATATRAETAAEVFERYKAATGGAHWDITHSWHGDGHLSAGGLSGEYHATVDLQTGRSADAYKMGSVEGGDGYDGTLSWERDPGGEIAAQDTPDAIRRGRSQAWLDARAYWYPQRLAATFAEVQTRQLGDAHYHVVDATPTGGDAVSLWFDDDSGLLVRVLQRQGPDTATTVLDDYRDVSGVRMPFHIITDLTDAAGRTDARRRVEVRIERATLNVATRDADFAMPAMAATARIDDAGGVTTIPFDLVNNHIYVDGTIDGKQARFLVDTGGVNMLTPASAGKFGLGGEGKLAAAGVGEERVDLGFAHAGEVRIGAAALANPVFYVIDIGRIPDIEGVEFDGLVGYEVFRRFAVQIDYGARRLVLTEPTRFSPPTTATAIPFTLDDRIPIVAGVLDGVPIRMSVDTGSRSSLTLNSPFVRQHELRERYHAAPESVLGWGVGGASRERAARFGTLALGDLHVDGIAGELFTGNKGSAANPDLGGNLGGAVLRRFTVWFDYANKKMYLKPNGDYCKSDAFDRSGLWLLRDGNALDVADVAPESAAARAGLQLHDRIVAFDGQTVSARPLAEWRERLRELPAGTKIDIAFERGGRAQHAALTLADRIPSKFTQ